MKKIILHIPHSSTIIPFKEGYLVDDKVLKDEQLKLTDWYTDDLFASATELSVIPPFSRIFCDPERFPEDNQEVMAQYGMGVLYEKSDDGRVIRQVTEALRTKILNQFYWPHHKRLSEAIKDQLEQYGKAIIIDCHSYPSVPLKRDLNKELNRPDFNIGTDGFHTPKKLIDISETFFKEREYSLGIDWPYKGAIVPLEYYQKDKNVQTIMLEINRALYLNEPGNDKSERYNEIKKVTNDFINEIRNSL